MKLNWNSLPMAIDMAPYAPWYQEITKRITESNGNEITTVVEAGTRYGCSAQIFLSVLKDCQSWQLHLIDPVPQKLALKLVDYYRKNLTFHKALAERSASKFQDSSVDLLHIDADVKGDHPYEMARDILIAFWNKLKPNASVILHDCTSRFPTIQRLAKELTDSGQWHIIYAHPQEACPISAPCLLTRITPITSLDGLTVVIPVIKDIYLESILQNIQANTIKPDELIVIDNSGSKLLEPVCSRYNDLSIRYLPQTHNIGVNASWNLGMSEAKTELVSILNDDLILPTGFFESILQVFASMASVGMVVPQTITNKKLVCTKPGQPQVAALPDREGWAVTVRKSAVPPIPSSLFTFYGDDWMYDCVQAHGLWCLKMMTTWIYHHVGCSRHPEERKVMGLPDLQQDREAWDSLKQEDLLSAR